MFNKDVLVFNQKTRRKSSIDFQSAEKMASRGIAKVKFLRLKNVAVEGNLSQKTQSPTYDTFFKIRFIGAYSLMAGTS